MFNRLSPSFGLCFSCLATLSLRSPGLLVVLLACCGSSTTAVPPKLQAENPSRSDGLQNGDLIFLDLDCGAPCDAIEEVTLTQFRLASPRLSHVGAILKEADSTFVVEAWPDGGVRKTPLAGVLSRVKAGENQASGYYFGRFRDEYRASAQLALQGMLGQIGKGYDDLFLLEKDRFYCSELVMVGFQTNTKVSFSPRAMSFGEAESPARRYWDEYYRKLGRPVPTGELGVSPLGLYLEGKARFFK